MAKLLILKKQNIRLARATGNDLKCNNSACAKPLHLGDKVERTRDHSHVRYYCEECSSKPVLVFQVPLGNKRKGAKI